MKTETAPAALMVTVVKILASAMAVAMADGDGYGGQNRVSGGSGKDSGYSGGRQQQKLQGQATINKNAAAVVAETAVVAVAIVAARLSQQAGVVAWWK